MGPLTLPPAGPVYADAQILIYSVEKHPVYAPLLRPLWAAVQSGSLEVISSELTVLETLIAPIRNGDASLIANYEGFFVQPGFQLIPVGGVVLRTAAQLRASTRLRTPDALHAATAQLTGCTLFLTNDKAFRGIAGLPLQILDDLLTP